MTVLYPPASWGHTLVKLHIMDSVQCRFCVSQPITKYQSDTISSPMPVHDLVRRRGDIASDLQRDSIDREFSALIEETAFIEEPISMNTSNKNRYFNVFPCTLHKNEATRVHLSGPDDYINASYIDGEIPGTHHRYIATQGPLEHTISDFWAMVWQEHSSVVVMMTAESEKGMAKSARYWPDNVNGVLEYDNDFKVRLIGEGPLISAADVIIRQIGVKHAGETRTILHIQYPEWNDFGVPNSTNGVCRLLDLLQKHESSGISGPLVVHCSAGIGRSGVFVAIHASLERITRCGDEIVDVPRTVARLRHQRGGCVQTVEQVPANLPILTLKVPICVSGYSGYV